MRAGPRGSADGRTLKPAGRGEYEIRDLNMRLVEAGKLDVSRMGRGMRWLDCGTAENLLEASEFVRVVEKRIGLQICCLEEIAYARKLIGRDALSALARATPNPPQRAYLERLLEPDEP